jgi:hypothetical protein
MIHGGNILNYVGHHYREHKTKMQAVRAFVFKVVQKRDNMLLAGEAMTIRGKARNASFVRAVSSQIILGLDFLHQNTQDKDASRSGLRVQSGPEAR